MASSRTCSNPKRAAARSAEPPSACATASSWPRSHSGSSWGRTGLLALSLRHALATPPGFRAEHVLTGQISLPWKNYPKDDKRLAFIERLLGELRTLPGVTRVGIDSCLPFRAATTTTPRQSRGSS